MPTDARRRVTRSTPTSDGRQYLCRCLDCGELEGWSAWGRKARREAFALAKQHAARTGHRTVVDECIYHSFEVTDERS